MRKHPSELVKGGDVDHYHPPLPAICDLLHAMQDLLENRVVAGRLGVVQAQDAGGFLKGEEIAQIGPAAQIFLQSGSSALPPAGNDPGRVRAPRHVQLDRAEIGLRRQGLVQPRLFCFNGQVFPVVPLEKGQNGDVGAKMRAIAAKDRQFIQGACAPAGSVQDRSPARTHLIDEMLAIVEANPFGKGITEDHQIDGCGGFRLRIAKTVTVDPCRDRHAHTAAQQHLGSGRPGQHRLGQSFGPQLGIQGLDRIGRRHGAAIAFQIGSAIDDPGQPHPLRQVMPAHVPLEHEHPGQDRAGCNPHRQRIVGRQKPGAANQQRGNRQRPQDITQQPGQV